MTEKFLCFVLVYLARRTRRYLLPCLPSTLKLSSNIVGVKDFGVTLRNPILNLVRKCCGVLRKSSKGMNKAKLPGTPALVALGSWNDWKGVWSSCDVNVSSCPIRSTKLMVKHKPPWLFVGSLKDTQDTFRKCFGDVCLWWAGPFPEGQLPVFWRPLPRTSGTGRAGTRLLPWPEHRAFHSYLPLETWIMFLTRVHRTGISCAFPQQTNHRNQFLFFLSN